MGEVRTDFSKKVQLGKTGLMVSRLGLGSSYPAPTRSYHEAFERGVNYFYWGSRRRDLMGDALRDIAKTKRDQLVVVLQSYARFGWMLKRSVESAIKSLGLDHGDVLLLGWFNGAPADRILDAAMDLKERGRIKHIAISSHNRPLFPKLLADERYDVWHVRYNAVHRGAEREVFPSVADLADVTRPGVVTYTTTRWGQLCDPAKTPKGERTPTGTDCYRFALSHPNVDVAISGPADEEQMRQALDTLGKGPMSADELSWMRRVGDHIYGKDVTTGVRDRV
jgi:aryl-alcohol dehydrogenase-like predicted oxidoreductase